MRRALTHVLARAHAPALARHRASDANASTLDLIRRLRERTGAPVVDVKRALDAHRGDVEAAFDALRARGLAAAAKKAGRASADGAAGVARVGRATCAAEVNSETDFVARGDAFVGLVGEVTRAIGTRLTVDDAFASEHASAERGEARAVSASRLAETTTVDGRTLSDAARDVAVSVRENVRVRRAFAYVAMDGEVVGTYVHGALAPGVGKQAACVVAKGVSEEFANKIAMHVVASAPLYLRSDCVPKEAYDREMAVFRAQTENTGKPANIVEKILLGRMNKYYEEVCLENQKFILDDSTTVGKAVKAEGGELIAFARIKVGEGIEVEQKDFAAEVAEAVRTT